MQQPINQVAVNEATRLVARFDTLIEDMQRACSAMLKESEATVARLSGRPTVRCLKCRVEVDATKINLPNRCMDRQCPVKQQEQQS